MQDALDDLSHFKPLLFRGGRVTSQDTSPLAATALPAERPGFHLCSAGQFRFASSMCWGIASDQVFFTPLL